jgi:protein-L-isoaspartate O-methyltransferase
METLSTLLHHVLLVSRALMLRWVAATFCAVCREAVQRAMLTCPRGSFVPEGYRAEAWVDSPIRVEEEDFNISAPHM